ncbi:MAG: sugar phosphate isomerase/epimerase [Candidatus Thermoplasmatota archaeon]|nr:sugar phosphate isomerase/epimerase [Candidatus Thermoplasmatota archaeon]
MSTSFHISSPSLCFLHLGEFIDELSDHFDGWQIIAEGKHSASNIAGEFSDISNSYELKYTVHLPFNDINVASLNRSIRMTSINECAENIRKFSDLGVKEFVIHPGIFSVLSMHDKERAMLLSREAIIALSTLARNLQSVLMVENMPSISATACSSPSDLTKLIYGTQAEFCYDISHAALDGDYASFLRFRNAIKMIDISDNDGKTDSHLQIGRGVLPVREMVKMALQLEVPIVIEAKNIKEAIEGKEYLSKL